MNVRGWLSLAISLALMGVACTTTEKRKAERDLDDARRKVQPALRAAEREVKKGAEAVKREVKELKRKAEADHDTSH